MIKHLLKQNVSIYAESTDLDNAGSPVTTFALKTSTAAAVQPVRSGEPVLGGRKFSAPVFNFYFDPDEVIEMTDRIFYNSNYYNIVELDTWPNTYIRCLGVKTENG